jgi:formate dehydrogenase major subunit
VNSNDAPIQKLTWDYPVDGPLEEPVAEAILREINGYTWPERQQIADFKYLKDDGSTACGCWIYTGVFPKDGTNLARSRKPDGPDGPGTHLGWGFAWPSNRRILYNRASADPNGEPWSPKKRYIWWNAAEKHWDGYDNPDFSPDKPPDYQVDWSKKPKGMDAHDGRSPFMMISDGKASIFVPAGLKDGPLPTHYEPVETPIANLLYPQQDNPVAKKWEREGNRYQAPGDPNFPYIITTYRLTEHHCGGMPTRMIPVAAELQPEGFVEIPLELAQEKGISSLDCVVLSTLRGEIETRALVTERLRPFTIDGKRVYEIAIPWHFGWLGYASGGIANALTAIVGDANVSIHEGKSFTCNLRKGRIPRDRCGEGQP